MNTIFTIIFVLGVLLGLAMSMLASWIVIQTESYWRNKRLLTNMEAGQPHPAEFHEHNEELERLRGMLQRQERLLPWWRRCYKIGLGVVGGLLVVSIIRLVLLAAGAAS